jgi:hypothetical protein
MRQKLFMFGSPYNLFMLQYDYYLDEHIPFYRLAEKTIDKVFNARRRGILNDTYSTWEY